LKQFWKKENIWEKDAISASLILETYLSKKNIW
jgi:RNase H-fold protein (predicted Holliday junction resolvase)